MKEEGIPAPHVAELRLITDYQKPLYSAQNTRHVHAFPHASRRLSNPRSAKTLRIRKKGKGKVVPAHEVKTYGGVEICL